MEYIFLDIRTRRGLRYTICSIMEIYDFGSYKIVVRQHCLHADLMLAILIYYQAIIAAIHTFRFCKHYLSDVLPFK